ncbi:MAG: hypothetical protein Kow0029_01830 [Candidatus Rifleibacteriota bacterium]
MEENYNDLQNLLKRYEQLSANLKNAIAGYRHGRQIRMIMSCIFWWVVYFFALLLIFLLIERTPIQSEFMRFLSSLFVYAGAVYFVFIGLKHLFFPPQDTILAVEIERSSEKFNSGLSSATEFLNTPADPGTSDTLRKLAVASVAEKLKPDDLVKSLKAFSRRQSAFWMFFSIAIVFVWYLISPLEVITGAKRLIFPMRAIAPYTSLELEVLPGHAVVARGNNLEISAKPSRFSDEPIILNLFEPEKDEGTTVEMYPDSNASSSRFVYTLTSLQSSVDYQVKCEKFSSQRYSVKVMPRPELKKLCLTLYQPDYIANGPQKLSEGVGDATVVTGSKVLIEGVADQNLKAAEIQLDPGGTRKCKLTGKNAFSFSIELATNTNYSLFLENEMGLRNEKPVQYSLKAITDAAPTVEILKPAQDMPFPTSKRLDIKAVSRDDFGVKAMILYYRIGDRSSLVPQNLKPDFKPVPEYEVEFPWMLDTLAVQPGIKVSYYIQAEDAKTPVPGVATTSTFHITMPSMYDLYRGEENAHEDINRKLQNFIEAQKLRKEALMKAYEQIRHEEKLDYEATKTIEKAIEQGEKQIKEAEKILDDLKNLEQKMEENPFSTPEALEKMQKVSELLNSVLDDETKKLMEQLRESFKDIKIDPKDLQKYEEAFKMEDYLKGLDRTINLLEQVREQQKFNAIGNTIEDLIRRQKQLASETGALKEKMDKEGLSSEEESKLNDLTDQQEKIGKELEQLQKQAEEMTKDQKNDDLQQNPLLEEVKNLRDQLKSNDYKKMSEDIKKEMQQKNLDTASKQQQKMLKFLEALKTSTRQICTSCSSGGMPPQLDLSAFIRRALQISFDQEKLFNMLDGMPGQFMRGQNPEIEGLIDHVSVLQVLIKQQGASLEYDLDNFIKTSFAIDPTVIESVKGTQKVFSNIVKNLEDRAISSSSEDQLEIIRRFNTLARELLRAQDQQSSGGSSPNPMNALQQFKDLTRRQLSLYRQMMKQQMSPGGQQMMEQLKKMAIEQRQIREALEKLMRESRQQMNTLGRLDDVVKDMKDLETQILDPNLRKKVAERQKKIYERMLKAQKAVKNRDEESEERKARKAKEILQQQPDKPIGDIGSDSLDLSKDFLTDMKEEFPPDYKQLLNDYYRSLNIYGGEK